MKGAEEAMIASGRQAGFEASGLADHGDVHRASRALDHRLGCLRRAAAAAGVAPLAGAGGEDAGHGVGAAVGNAVAGIFQRLARPESVLEPFGARRGRP